MLPSFSGGYHGGGGGGGGGKDGADGDAHQEDNHCPATAMVTHPSGNIPHNRRYTAVRTFVVSINVSGTKSYNRLPATLVTMTTAKQTCAGQCRGKGGVCFHTLFFSELIDLRDSKLSTTLF